MAGTKQFNEEEALDRALDLFWRRGFGPTSMQDLAQATGVIRGSLYHAYGDKQAIFCGYSSATRNASWPG
jgi:AcrR family transcriptional regulator